MTKKDPAASGAAPKESCARSLAGPRRGRMHQSDAGRWSVVDKVSVESLLKHVVVEESGKIGAGPKRGVANESCLCLCQIRVPKWSRWSGNQCD